MDIGKLAQQDVAALGMKADEGLGKHLAWRLQVGQRVGQCSELRRRIQGEGGLCAGLSWVQDVRDDRLKL